MASTRVEVPFGNSNLIIETGKIAKQASGAVTVTAGGTVVLVAVCMAKRPKEGTDFFPLTVEYQEKTYSAGKIPGGFFKREGRSTEREILVSRLIDRSIRPLFPAGCFNEVQVVASVLSHDGENDPDILSMIGASAALMISDIPFDGPIGAVRICELNGQLVANPTFLARKENNTMDLVVAGWGEGIIMIEGEANEVPDARVMEGFKLAVKELEAVKKAQIQLAKEVGKPKIQIPLQVVNPAFVDFVRKEALGPLNEAYTKIADKLKREAAVNAIFEKLTGDLTPYASFNTEDHEISVHDVAAQFESLQYEVIRNNVFDKGVRADGRGLKDIRPIDCEVGVLPRTHGSALFTRGQTQSLGIVTLGTKDDEQLVEGLEETS
ncbi:MAG: polyribonucleotide nucleotidyltransferase, partial [Candidatus Omnitrophica bacterium]|nr:polyribonucleotide nucleotidyltransferase [Candidatus Omnitrophota bacterium]